MASAPTWQLIELALAHRLNRRAMHAGRDSSLATGCLPDWERASAQRLRLHLDDCNGALVYGPQALDSPRLAHCQPEIFPH